MDFKGFVKGFDAWEHAAAEYTEQVFRSPLLLNPLGAGMTALFRAKADADRALSMFWSTVGLPTRVGEERTLHALNQLQSRMLDLEERLAQLCAAQATQVRDAQATQGGDARSQSAESGTPAQPTAAAAAPERAQKRARGVAREPSAKAKRAREPRAKDTPSKLATAEAGPADLFSAPPPSPSPAIEKRRRSRRKSPSPQSPNG